MPAAPSSELRCRCRCRCTDRMQISCVDMRSAALPHAGPSVALWNEKKMPLQCVVLRKRRVFPAKIIHAKYAFDYISLKVACWVSQRTENMHFIQSIANYRARRGRGPRVDRRGEVRSAQVTRASSSCCCVDHTSYHTLIGSLRCFPSSQS